MCGIAGFVSFNGSVDRGVLTAMTRSLERRGPDGFGIWADEGQGVGLGHQRLAILDLSASADQPMHSPCGRYAMVYNGEIYNHLDIRRRLQTEASDLRFRGTGDTETLLAAIAAWGFEETLATLNGMFAIAVWDRKLRRLFLARDRAGEKPLYFARLASAFVFGSQINALARHQAWEGRLDVDSVREYTRLNYVPAPATIFRDVHKVRPAEFIVIDEQGEVVDQRIYWSPSDSLETELPKVTGSTDETLSHLETALHEAVRSRMLSDVPIGAFLSGGIDSSLVSALMQANSSGPIRTFSIGSDQIEADEAKYAKQVARHLGSDHTELYISEDEVKKALPLMPQIFDEPLADASQIPTFLVCQLAVKDIKVVLSGDGGDELFAGYNRHRLAPRLWKRLRLVPMPLRPLLTGLVRPVSAMDAARMSRITGGRIQGAEGQIQLYKLAGALRARTHDEFYELLQTNWITSPCVFQTSPRSAEMRREGWSGEGAFLQSMLQRDFDRFLPDDVLVKLDRASMASSLEARAPLLDHRVVEFARAMAVGDGGSLHLNETKWALRRVLDKYVPRHLWDRPKQGFHAPIEKWLRSGPLRDWMEDLLSNQSLANSGVFDYALIEKRLTSFLNGDDRHFFGLWNILMFQAWHREKKTEFKISV